MESLIESQTISQPPARKVYGFDKSSVNGRLADEIVRYRYHLVAVENHQVREVLRQFTGALQDIDLLFNEKNPFLLHHLSNARLYPSNKEIQSTDEVALPIAARSVSGKSPLSPHGVEQIVSVLLPMLSQALNALIDKIDLMIYNAQLQVADAVADTLAKIVSEQLPSTVRFANVTVSHDALGEGLILGWWNATLTEALDGKNRKVLKARHDKTLKKIEAQIRLGFQNGQSVKQIANNIKGVVRKNYAGAAALLARNGVQRMANKAAKELFAKNADIIAAEVWLATLDEVICLQCGNLDGQEFPVGKGPQPIDDTHLNCRCQRVPKVKSWEELGVNVNDLPAKARKMGAGIKRVTFHDWFEDQPEKVQRDILGKKRYELYREGALDIKDFATNKRVFTLKQLKRKYKV